jgi:hypothetical protein
VCIILGIYAPRYPYSYTGVFGYCPFPTPSPSSPSSSLSVLLALCVVLLHVCMRASSNVQTEVFLKKTPLSHNEVHLHNTFLATHQVWIRFCILAYMGVFQTVPLTVLLEPAHACLILCVCVHSITNTFYLHHFDSVTRVFAVGCVSVCVYVCVWTCVWSILSIISIYLCIKHFQHTHTRIHTHSATQVLFFLAQGLFSFSRYVFIYLCVCVYVCACMFVCVYLYDPHIHRYICTAPWHGSRQWAV